MNRPAIERRIVTVLFADIVGFTSLSERLDPEDLATVQEAYFGEVRATIDRYGGRLEKFIGDAAMAVFGVPRTREDDAERAVRAALALSSAVEALCPRIGLDAGQLRLRVGLNTGEVAYASVTDTQTEGRVTGDTVNVAARLQAAAPVGAVLVGEATALAVAESIELGPLEGLELKGKADPVRAALARSVLSERSRDRAMGVLRAPLQGRARELAILEAATDRAAAGAVEAWCVVAPPGVGKSRLLEELERSIRSHADPGREPRIWRTRLRPEQMAPYRAVADLIGAAVQGADLAATMAASGSTPERAAVVASEVVGLVGAAGDAAAPAAAEATAGTGAAELGGQRDAHFAAWLEALEALARGDPATWIVEDVHWAGGDLLAFLGFAAARPSAAGRLILATARPSLLERAPEWIGAGSVHRLDLDPLPGEDAGKLVRALVADALPPDLVAAIAERADGNPLFIEELLRTWASVGVLRRGPGDAAWELAVAPETVPLPQTVQQIYAAQLDDLPGGARLLARRASVAGRHFPVAALPPLGVEAPGEGLEVLRTRALLAGPRREPITGDSYGYRHALLRDAGYASLARGERALLHVRLAGWLAEVAGDRRPLVAELIGGHYAAALAAASPLAAEVAEGLDRPAVAALAAQHLELAAERALEVAAHEAARALLHRALEHTDERHPLDRARLLNRLGTVTAAGGAMDEAMGQLEEARRLYADGLGGKEGARARDGYAAASAGAARLLIEQLRFRDGAALAREALATIGEREDLATARLLLARAHGDFYETNDVARALEELAPILETARAAGDGELELAARKLEAYARAEGGLAGAEAFEALESVARRQAAWDDVASCLINRAAYAEGRPAEAEALLGEAERIATAHGLTQRLAWLAHSRADLAFRSGAWDEALRHGLDAVASAEANGYHRIAVRTWFILVPIAAFRGDRPLLARVAAWFDARSDLPDSPYGRLMHGAVDLDLARFGLRPSFVPDPERLAAAWQAPEGSNFVAAMERIVDAWLSEGLLEPAHEAIERIEARIGPYTEPFGWSSCHLLRARWLAATGAGADLVTAKAREALEAARESGAARWILRALESLEAAGSATPEEMAEGRAIEASLRGASGAPERPV